MVQTRTFEILSDNVSILNDTSLIYIDGTANKSSSLVRVRVCYYKGNSGIQNEKGREGGNDLGILKQLVKQTYFFWHKF